MNTADAIKSSSLTNKENFNNAEQWTEIIKPQSNFLELRLGELWRYRDLILMFVKRDIISTYKQTILGPIWFFIQPLLTTLTYMIIFGRVARISTEGLPTSLFYLAGITVWNYFAQTLTATSTVFTSNAQIFGKVYFPRLAMPIAIVISNLVRFAIQFLLFFAVWLYYLIKGNTIHPNVYILLMPLLVVIMGLLSLGLGMIFSSLTTKYRDLAMLLTFGVQLLMYATPVIYPLSSLSEKYRWIILANPMTSIVETFKYAFLGSGTFNWMYLGYSLLFAIIIVLVGTVTFNKVQKSFMDTV